MFENFCFFPLLLKPLNLTDFIDVRTRLLESAHCLPMFPCLL
jgi:hypothetical protein